MKILSSSQKRKMQGPQDSGMRRRKRPKRAKLQRILDLPEDIFDVIAEFLHPATLISLSRVSRAFRAHISSDILWTNCRKRAGLPDLEANDITDRQYIHLLFDTHCHVIQSFLYARLNFYNFYHEGLRATQYSELRFA
ncbi:hypothetical protein DL96DRAFT_1009518 [Flagelloscypha sp. PMI_526]|nr:hypothetical protein DL96DRAFT_1009518 [Flagelloscypha sp. PMI_526]